MISIFYFFGFHLPFQVNVPTILIDFFYLYRNKYCE